MEDPAGATLLDPALELAVVPVVGGIGDPQVVGASVGQMINAGKKKYFKLKDNIYIYIYIYIYINVVIYNAKSIKAGYRISGCNTARKTLWF